MIMINLFGVLLISLIVWWFWLYKPAATKLEHDDLTILVADGTYQPSRIKVPSGRPVHLNFLRKDESPCAGTVLFSDLNITEELQVNQPKSISLPALEKGEYPFTCQMQMYRGVLVVE